MAKGNKRTKDERTNNFLERYAISIKVFIKRCLLSMTNNDLMKQELTHRDLVKLFPYLQRTSYDLIMDDPALVCTGEVVIVMDDNGIMIPYINSTLFPEHELCEVMDAKEWDTDTDDWTSQNNDIPVKIDELKSLSNYELETLMKIYQKSGQWHSYEVVRRELTSRNDCQRANKVSKRKALQRSEKRIKNDEY